MRRVGFAVDWDGNHNRDAAYRSPVRAAPRPPDSWSNLLHPCLSLGSVDLLESCDAFVRARRPEPSAFATAERSMR
jgi:hypothetical protein